jgi:hypothetical protein
MFCLWEGRANLGSADIAAGKLPGDVNHAPLFEERQKTKRARPFVSSAILCKQADAENYRQEEQDCKHKEDAEENLGDRCGPTCNPAKAERSSNDSDYERNNGPP